MVPLTDSRLGAHIPSGARGLNPDPASNQLPANAPQEAADDGSSTWVPATPLGAWMELLAPGSCLAQPLLLAATWEVTQQVEDLILCLFLSLLGSLSNK